MWKSVKKFQKGYLQTLFFVVHYGKSKWDILGGFLEKNSVGRYTHQTTLNKEKGIYIVLKLT